MIYMYVKCEFDHEDQPLEIYSEMDDERIETRKIHVFCDGHVEIASTQFETVTTGLSSEPLPSVEEINADKQFQAKLIPKSLFEDKWAQHFNNDLYFRREFG